MQPVQEWTDAFGKQIADGTFNKLDIATQYNFSPERVRLFRNGSREFPQYNSISQFNDGADIWQLQPDAGDTMHVESAESSTYTVQYVMQASFALELNQSLSSGDKLRIGAYNGTDGWVLEQRGSDHTDTQVDIIESSAGTETTLESDADLSKPVTDWTRYEIDYNWYGVGNQIWRQTYTDGGNQINGEITKTSNDGERGPETGNLNLWYEIQADSSTSGLELNVGSMGLVELGDTTTINRDKPQFEDISVSGSADTWEPIYAIRIDPNDSNVNAQLVELEVLNYGANDDIEMVVTSVDPSKTDISSSDWSDPDYHHATNSAIQSTTSVSQVPDTNGTQKDLGSSDKFGGFTLGSAVELSGGNRNGSSATQNDARIEKKAVLDSDHIVFLVRSSTVDGSNVQFVWDVDQNW